MGGVSLRIACVAGMLCSACGALDDLSATRAEVEQSNKNMGKLIAQGDTVVRKLTESLQAVHDSNSHQKAIILQGDSMSAKLTDSLAAVQESLQKMQTLVDQGEGVGRRLDESIAEVRKSNLNMNSLIVQSQAMAGQLDESTSVARTILDQIRKTNRLSQEMVEKVRKQEQVILADILQKLSNDVADLQKENLYRIGAAATAYEIILTEKLDGRWLDFIAANLQMCHKRRVEPYGTLCTDKFAPERLSEVPVAYGEKSHEELEKLVRRLLPEDRANRVIDGLQGLFDLLPLASFSRNVVWALAMPAGLIPMFYEHFIGDPRNPQTLKVGTFLRFARGALLGSMSEMVKQEEDGQALATYKLEAFRTRKEVVEAIHKLPSFLKEGEVGELVAIVQRLIDLLTQRGETLSPIDQQILSAIRM